MAHYQWTQLLHLLMGIAFAGTVFFEVMILGALAADTDKDKLRHVETAIGNRAVQVMPFVIVLLFATGLAMAWVHRGALLQPAGSHFAWLLWMKMALAFSVLGHFFTAMWWRRKGALNGRRSRLIHYSVFAHVLAIVVLAKGMFFF